MTQDIIIRKAQEADMEELVRLCQLHAAYEKAEYYTDGKREALTSTFCGEDSPMQCLIAIRSGDIVGYATYGKQFSTWDVNYYIYMDCLFLKEEARGHGIGELLVEEIKKDSLLQGCDLIQWHTPTFNTRAMKFYRRIGATSKTKERFFLSLEDNKSIE